MQSILVKRTTSTTTTFEEMQNYKISQSEIQSRPRIVKTKIVQGASSIFLP